MKKQGFNPYLPSWEHVPGGESLACIKVDYDNIWTEYSSDINLPDGIRALYFIYKGNGFASLASFTFE